MYTANDAPVAVILAMENLSVLICDVMYENVNIGGDTNVLLNVIFIFCTPFCTVVVVAFPQSKLLFNEEKEPVNPEPQGSNFYTKKG